MIYDKMIDDLWFLISDDLIDDSQYDNLLHYITLCYANASLLLALCYANASLQHVNIVIIYNS